MFSVFSSSYVNTALDQSAIRIQTCYIIIKKYKTFFLLIYSYTNTSVTATPNTAGNDDFSPKTIDVTFQPGEKGPKSIPIDIIDDNVVEPLEEFTVSMSSSSPGVTVGGPATVLARGGIFSRTVGNIVYHFKANVRLRTRA